MNKTAWLILLIILVIFGGYYFWKAYYPTPTPTPTLSPSPTVQAITPEGSPAPSPEVREITVVGSEFSFSPSSITVKTGEKVKIDFRNLGRASHNLMIEGLGVGTRTISGGQSDVIEFTAPASGTYNFFCSVPGHRSSGMEGDLKVE